MHCTFQRALSDTQKLSDGVKGSLSKISLGKNNLGTSLEDFKICPQGYRSMQDRCTIVTFLTLESDGRWRVVTLPLQCPERKNHVECGALVNTDGLPLVSSQLIRSCKIDQFQVLKGPPFDVMYSKLSSRIYHGSNRQGQSCNKTLTEKVTKSFKNYGKSSVDNLFTHIDSPLLIPHGSGSTHFPDVIIESFKVDVTLRKNVRKKTRKKGKHNKKFPGSPELEVSKEYAIGNLASEICGHNDGDGLGSCATSQELSLLDCRVNGNIFEINSFGFINYSETPGACTSSADGILTEATELPEFDGVENKHDVQISCYDDMDSQGVSDMRDLLVLDAISVGTNDDLQISCYGDLHLEGVSDMCNSVVLDLVSVGSKSDGSTDASHDAKPFKNVSSGTFVSEPSNIHLSHGNLFNVLDDCEHTERSKPSSQGSSSSEMQSAVPGKRGKQSKMFSRSSNAYKLGSVGNLHGHTGKENNHSVWQKVQRKDADGCNKQVKKDTNLKEAPMLKRNSNATQANMPSKTVNNKQLKEKTSRKSKRKSSQASKQEVYSRNKSPANACSQVSIIQQNQVSDVSSQVLQQGLTRVSRSHSHIRCPKDGIQANRVECMASESMHSHPVCPDEVDSCRSVYKRFSQDIENPDNTFLKSSDALGQSNLLHMRSLYLPHVVINEVAQVQKENSLSENRKPNYNSGSVLQKWVPVGLKHPGTTLSSRSDSFSLDNIDGPTAGSWSMKHILPEKGASDSQIVSPKNVGAESMGQSCGNVDLFPRNQESQIQNKNQSACKSNEDATIFGATSCSSAESRDQNFGLTESDSNKLVEAVNHACRVQLASEAVQAATGGPIAEFEKLLHFTSPVVCASQNRLSCQACPRDKISDALVCRHKIPNIPLGCLWEWYEKHGSYGLEVKAEDNKNTQRLGDDSSSFRAYFVPLLSAIQLFSNSKSQSSSNDNSVPGVNVLAAPAGDRTSEKSSNVGHLPIFSVLVPQPRNEPACVLPEHCSVLPSVSPQGGLSCHLANNTCSNDPELLFEYFECEQPQQRQPMYEKITELVRGGRPSQCKIYGDATKLNSINLHDLHPRSWYSVAWYPIYRIPDGNFRAAFLTYHSFGHLTYRRPKFDSPGSIISPVVGLQSYNAQGECWFQMRHSTAESPSLNPCAIVKERLRTLEETASLMARAVVNRGHMTSVNRHPDYEFFLSRRHY